MNGVSVRYWLLLLRKPGQWMEFDAASMGVTPKTLINYIDVQNGHAGGIYKACSLGNSRVGVRRVHPAGGRI